MRLRTNWARLPRADQARRKRLWLTSQGRASICGLCCGATLVFAVVLATLALGCSRSARETDPSAVTEHTGRFNVLLVVFEDLSPRIGAFGDPVATTPVLDRFAAEAIRFPNTFATSGVCAPSRAALITGVYQQRLAAQHMRTRAAIQGWSSGGPLPYDAVPPPEVKAFPELLRAAGFYTSNDAKEDYQFGSPVTIWDDSGPGARWTERQPGQPFFSMITLVRTHESYLWPEQASAEDSDLVKMVAARNQTELEGKPRLTDPAEVEVPPFYPDTAVIRADLARQYDNLAFEERRLQQILDQLAADGLDDSTVVIVTTDHGDGLPRMKRTVYDGGIRVPLMVRYPDRRGAGQKHDQLVSFVDLAPSILSLAQVEGPAWLDGRVFLDASAPNGVRLEDQRQVVFAAADRHDKVPGRTRAVRNRRYKLMYNFEPEVPLYEFLAFRSVLPTMKELRRAYAAGELDAVQAAGFVTPRPKVELYDLAEDPYEVNNLAEDPALAPVRRRLAGELEQWIEAMLPNDGADEAEMVARLWQGASSQPRTEAPTLALKTDTGTSRLVIACETPGASIAYRLEGDREGWWRLYTGPTAVEAGLTAKVEAQAIRYGFLPSNTTAMKIPSTSGEPAE